MGEAFVVLSLLVVVSSSGVCQVMSCETDYDGPGKRVPGTPPDFRLKKPFPTRFLCRTTYSPCFAQTRRMLESWKLVLGEVSLRYHGNGLRLPNSKSPITNCRAHCKDCKCLPVELRRCVGVWLFWVFRQAPTGYQLLLREQTQALQVLATRTAGYPDLRTIWEGTGRMEISQNVYTFRDGKYEETVLTS